MRARSDETSITLAELAPGQQGEIVGIDTDDGKLKRRMASLGVVPGAAITLDRTAPLGDPRMYTLMNANLGFRNTEAQIIQIRLKV